MQLPSPAATEPVQKVKKKFDLDLLPFDLRVSGRRGHAKHYRSTKFGVDSSSRFRFGAQKNRQTALNALYHPAAIHVQLAWIIITSTHTV